MGLCQTSTDASLETIVERVQYRLSGLGGPPPDKERIRAILGALTVSDAVALAAWHEPPGQRITHGRHCTCRPCKVEDWTSPDLAPCGMHGADCPALYQPWGPAGTYFDPAKGAPRG